MPGNRFLTGTHAYEAWLGGLIPLDRNELREKHESMKAEPFEFLRASFYRWAVLWREPSETTGLGDAPEVLGVGDLHLENFGTWRDVDGRLVWGINDFDEACPLPYVNDLVRLAVSAEMAIESEKTDTRFRPRSRGERACDAVLKGYTQGMVDGLGQRDERRPFVLAERHDWLRTLVVEKLERRDKDGRTKFDKIIEELRTGEMAAVTSEVPPAAQEALLAAFPPPEPVPGQYRVGHRTAGLGSLGRQRFTAVVDDWKGGLIAREVKALAPSAWLWANDRATAGGSWYDTLLQKAVRSPDPWMRVHQGWVVRRLAPDAGKIKLDDLPSELDEKLLRAMGRETANVHSMSRQPLDVVFDDLRRRSEKKPGWFRRVVDRMKQVTLDDWDDCKRAAL